MDVSHVIRWMYKSFLFCIEVFVCAFVAPIAIYPSSDEPFLYIRAHHVKVLQQQHETGECQCDFKPLRMFVSGIGGTGKSFLIEAIMLLVGMLLVGKIWPSKEVTVAPSGWKSDLSQALSAAHRA